jgi:hypothetical protein
VPRPRSEDPKRPLSLSLRASTVAALAVEAEGAGMTASAYLSHDVERRFAPLGDDCPHPDNKRRRLLGRALCGACGVRLSEA